MEKVFNKICVIGLGYIGLPTAAILASRGVEIVGIDINQTTIDTINSGKVHIIEPDLEAVVRVAVTDKRLTAKSKAEEADAFIIAVPTPFTKNYEADLSFVKNAITNISNKLKKGNLIILESTSPVGTTDKIASWLAELRPDLTFPNSQQNNPDVNIAYCPERVLPGHILKELVSNVRVIGGITESCSNAAKNLYKIFVENECIITNAKTAEMAKLTENAYRDVNIAFANELSLICDDLDINTWEPIKLANKHPRVNILQPGPGVGGHCIAVDPWFIVQSSKHAKLIKTAREVNSFKPKFIADKVLELAKKFNSPAIACLGLSYKKNIDDLRESPAVEIINHLADKNPELKLLVVEPHIKTLPQNLAQFKNIELCSTEIALSGSEIILGLVAHQEFENLDLNKYTEKEIIDCCGLF